jgi:hypothetical protein
VNTALVAFARALNAIEPVAKTQTADTGKYKYSYADLNDVLDECKRVCQLFGLAITQSVSANDAGLLALSTMVIHADTGESVSFPALMMKMPPDAQALGSAVTYARRYSLLAIFGIAPEDDDGRAATVAAQAQPGRRTEAERMVRELMGEMDPDVQAEFVKDFKVEFRCGLSDLPASRHGQALTFTREWVARHEGGGDAALPSQLPTDQEEPG